MSLFHATLLLFVFVFNAAEITTYSLCSKCSAGSFSINFPHQYSCGWLKAMARGWESKAVADQIEEGESRQQQPSKTETTKEQRMLKERLHSLNLSRSRLLQQLEHARHPAHRNVLLNGLRAVEREIEEVSAKVP